MHSTYYNSKGEIVPSVTTILKILNKPVLVKWANFMGFKRMTVDTILETSSYIGTFVHTMIEADLMNRYVIYSMARVNSKKTIANCIKNYFLWKVSHEIEPIFMEKSFSNESFGGTTDFYGIFNGKKTLLDFKTSKNIYMSMFIQLAGYTILLEEQGYEIEQVGIASFSEKRICEHYLSRKDLDSYIIFFSELVLIFKQWNEISKKDGWENEYIN